MQSCANLCACASKCAHVHFFAQDVQIIAKVHIEIFISIIRIQKESAEPIQSSKAKQLGIHLKQLAYSTTCEKPLPPHQGKTTTRQQQQDSQQHAKTRLAAMPTTSVSM